MKEFFTETLILELVASGKVQVGPVISSVMESDPSLQQMSKKQARYHAYNALHSLTRDGVLEQYQTWKPATGRKVEALQLTEKGLGLFKPYR